MTFPGADTMKEGISEAVLERWGLVVTGDASPLGADEVISFARLVPPCNRRPSTTFVVPIVRCTRPLVVSVIAFSSCSICVGRVV
jgi:hypothetical protein